MKVLLIGYGSIGKRHEEVLSAFKSIESVDIVTKQDILKRQCFKTLEDVKDINQYDYFILSTPTNKHYEQLKYLEEQVENKLIFCEKPLFESKRNLSIKNNKVYLGYVLRFHPLLQKLKKLLKDETIISLHAKCGQYLPTWRSNIDYKDCYSAKKEEGGGVLLDLSHEIDYVYWLSDKIIDIKSYQVHISDLEINTDDLTMFIGKTTSNAMVNISINYISKIAHRFLFVETLESSFQLDFIENELVTKNKTGDIQKYSLENLERNEMFQQMHLDILNKQETVCSYQEGLEVMDMIANIQEQNI